MAEVRYTFFELLNLILKEYSIENSNGWGISCGGAGLVLTGSIPCFKRRQLNALVRFCYYVPLL
jgi:hypothetical protein